MAKLSELQIEKIKQHMLHEEDALSQRFKSKNSRYDKEKIPLSEKEAYENHGWMVEKELKKKVSMIRLKEHGRQFEDDIWCMFFNLGFRILNSDDQLRIQWGENVGEDKQIDVVAIGDDAIFVVECKSAEKPKKQSFQKELLEIVQYKDGVCESLRQIYGKQKRVKFIFATRNFRIEDEGDDYWRMKNNGIYHLDENSYNYINNLIKSYQSSVVYQFYGIMFKNELISDDRIVIPALKGEMGDKEYFLFSIEPKTLLKVGFVLHRTKVNDSMAPTYQRLLVPKRLNGITKFIDDGGYFPNSIILNFDEPNENLKLKFDSIHKENGSNAEFGLLNIPNAYGIAYIIDGQHRVYGYANSLYKDKHTIPVVAFQNMTSEEQLKIFMEINENQKSVSKNLKIDLEEDLFWLSPRCDSRMKALRSSVIKMLGTKSDSVLRGKITIGEDSSELSSVNFENALKQSKLIPKANNTKWVGDVDYSLYDINETNIDKAMQEARKYIFQYLNGCYTIADDDLDDDTKSKYLFYNRATFPFVKLSGLIHAFLYECGDIHVGMSISERLAKVKPYIETLCEGLSNITEDVATELSGIQGQGAEKKWLLVYQDIINKKYPEYLPDELKEWRETKDEELQEEGDNRKKEILTIVRDLFFVKLKELPVNVQNKTMLKLKNECESKILKEHENDDDFDISNCDWKEWLEVSDFKKIIEQNYAQSDFSEVFGIPLSDKDTSKKDKLKWLSLIDTGKGKKSQLTKSDVNRLWMILDHLRKYLPEE